MSEIVSESSRKEKDNYFSNQLDISLMPRLG